MKYGRIENCQACDNPELRTVLSLGYLPPVNTMRAIGERADEQTWFPAEWLYCPRCYLVQLGFAVEPSILFPPDYPYTSGTTRILRENFAELYRDVQENIGLSSDHLVVDIGSNDGTLLSNFAAGGHRVCGIEPTTAGDIAVNRGIATVRGFLSEESVDAVIRLHGRPSIVTATNVFAHIHGLPSVIECITNLIGDDGVFISESHYLLDLVRSLQYDTIYHEHLRYYSLHSLKELLNKYGFRVFEAKRIPTHGGSIRVYASRSHRYAITKSVENLLQEEQGDGITTNAWMAPFARRVARSKLALYDLLGQYKRKGLAIYGIGAPSRASTLINYVGLDEGILDCVLEVSSSLKVGKYIPGTNIPVQDESKLFADPPAAVLLLSWHIADEICSNLKKKGYEGDFIVPLPEPRISGNVNVRN